MISEFVDKIISDQDALVEAALAAYKNSSCSWETMVKLVVQHLHEIDNLSELPDPERIERINWGYYQGILLFVIGATGYQPSVFWTVKVYYGSCACCDSLENVLAKLSRSETISPEDLNACKASLRQLFINIAQRIRRVEPEF